jgi:transcriptional regulator GlxA family with amidase domain
LVLESDMKISDICGNCGFNTLSFFIKQYKTKYRLTPLEHRKKIKEKPLD